MLKQVKLLRGNDKICEPIVSFGFTGLKGLVLTRHNVLRVSCGVACQIHLGQGWIGSCLLPPATGVAVGRRAKRRELNALVKYSEI